MIILALIAAAAVLVSLVLTWYFADDQPLFSPTAEQRQTRVTFKKTVQSFLRDSLDVFDPLVQFARRLWLFWGPRLTNVVAGCVIAMDAYIVQHPDFQSMLTQSTVPLFGAQVSGWVFVIAINLGATLTPRGAPATLPA